MDIERRLERLEKSVRRWKTVTAALVLTLVVGATVAQTKSDVTATLTCKMLAIVDEQGKDRVLLSSGPNGPLLTMIDAHGKAKTSLSGGEGWSHLTMWDAHNKARLTLWAADEGAGLNLRDGLGKHRAALGSTMDIAKSGIQTKYPESSIRLYGPDGKHLWSAP